MNKIMGLASSGLYRLIFTRQAHPKVDTVKYQHKLSTATKEILDWRPRRHSCLYVAYILHYLSVGLLLAGVLATLIVAFLLLTSLIYDYENLLPVLDVIIPITFMVLSVSFLTTVYTEYAASLNSAAEPSQIKIIMDFINLPNCNHEDDGSHHFVIRDVRDAFLPAYKKGDIYNPDIISLIIKIAKYQTARADYKLELLKRKIYQSVE